MQAAQEVWATIAADHAAMDKDQEAFPSSLASSCEEMDIFAEKQQPESGCTDFFLSPGPAKIYLDGFFRDGSNVNIFYDDRGFRELYVITQQ